MVGCLVPAYLTQHDCHRIAAKLNRRPRKRFAYRTPEECYVRSTSVLHFKVDIRPHALVPQHPD